LFYRYQKGKLEISTEVIIPVRLIYVLVVFRFFERLTALGAKIIGGLVFLSAKTAEYIFKFHFSTHDLS